MHAGTAGWMEKLIWRDDSKTRKTGLVKKKVLEGKCKIPDSKGKKRTAEGFVLFFPPLDG